MIDVFVESCRGAETESPSVDTPETKPKGSTTLVVAIEPKGHRPWPHLELEML